MSGTAPEEPAPTIGLALSGGGHRAAAFALGALLYLVDCGQNRRVTSISSVSGGSLANAFLALLGSDPNAEDEKAFNEMERSEFDQHAARFAKRLSGHPIWWWAALSLFSLALTAWLVITWFALPDSVSLVWQVPFLVPIVICAMIGQLSGGSFWGHWVSWVFAGCISFIFSLGVLAITADIFFGHSTGIFGAICLLVAGTLFAFRTRVSQMALAKTICSINGTSVSLKDVSGSIRHVFSATEVDSDDHVFFSRDEINAMGLGRVEPGNLKLGKVVQASANTPFVFPPLHFRASDLGPKHADLTKKSWVLSDGGVTDALGATWYLEAAGSVFDQDDAPDSQNPDPEHGEQTDASGKSTQQLLVINGSAPIQSERENTWLSPLGDVNGLMRLPEVIFHSEARRQIRDFRTYFALPAGDKQARTGAVAASDENPCEVIERYMGASSDVPILSYPARNAMDQRIEKAASQAFVIWRHGEDGERRRNELEAELRNIDHQVTVLKEELWDLEKQLEAFDRASFEYREIYDQISDVKKEIIGLNTDSRRECLEGLGEPKGKTELEDRLKENSEIKKALQKTVKIPASFQPLGTSNTALLLWQGYLSMMINANIFLGLPMIDDARSLAGFRALAKGHGRPQTPADAEKHHPFSPGRIAAGIGMAGLASKQT